MNNKSNTSVSGFRGGLALVMFSALLMAGCERPMPETDKKPESSLEFRQKPSSQPNPKTMPNQWRRPGNRTLVA
jgi:PBP1b-binding outer membrane lipoprotein LpoB